MGRLAAAFSGMGLAATVLWCAVSDALYQSFVLAGTGDAPAACAQCEASPDGSASNCEKYRPIAAQLMREAARLAEDGRIDAARNLAQRAARFPIRWLPGEQSPGEFLSAISQSPQRHAGPIARVPALPAPESTSRPAARPIAVAIPDRFARAVNQQNKASGIPRTRTGRPTPAARAVPRPLPEPEIQAASKSVRTVVPRAIAVPVVESPSTFNPDSFPVAADPIEQAAAPVPQLLGLPIPDDRQLACRVVDGRPVGDVTLSPQKAAAPVFAGFHSINEIESPRRIDEREIETLVIQSASAEVAVGEPEVRFNESLPAQASENEKEIIRPTPLSIPSAPTLEWPLSSPRGQAASPHGRPLTTQELWERYQEYVDRGRVRISDMQ